ncbi:branched-chain amino acid ABC transporter permease [Tepidiforma flava]|uniref:Branched-chain amino acid ABC transporter permease n=1 Tax=Tepidiforma flava TaxID=3004094 RepID=A0ABY7M8F2_9CHLR|nr:branched-chain amino acid ABC transporter permease [Tepidiforma flava]WBL36432.1 branched-chain amino acid ABC transporter permease [Tepidiforma flava]
MPVALTLSVSFWSDQFVNGLTTGSLYALIALGYTMVYGVLKMINFAHGEVFMLGSFAGYGALVAMGGNELSGPVIALAILGAIIVAMSASVSASVVIERLAYRPLRGAPASPPHQRHRRLHLPPVPRPRADFRPREVLPRHLPRGSLSAGPFEITYIQLFLIASSVAMMALLYAIIQRTRLGRAIRAVAENPTNASLMGVDVNRTIVFVFILGAAMAGVAGVLYGLFFQTIRGSMGFIPGIKAFTAAVLGGIGSIPGAMAGGYVLGLAETVGRELLNELPGVNLGNQWRDVIAFTLLVTILIFRPTGIFAQRSTTRA